MTEISKSKSSTKINTDELKVLKKSNRSFSAFAKRMFDIVASALGLFFLSPIFALIALGIKRDSQGPTFYRGERVGRNGERFNMLKFRTMYETPESYNGSPITCNGDARVTPFGRWLRATKLNELPQLWNVLKGEMSLVGPRPEDPEFVAEWPEDVREKVLNMRPGITSPASIVYRDEERLLSGKGFIDEYLKKILPDKLRLDQLYIDNQSFVSDLDVLFMTVIAFLPRLRNINVKEKWLYSGTFYTITYRVLIWFFVDLITIILTIGLAGIIWRVSSPLNLGVDTFLFGSFLVSLLITLINTAFGLHRIDWERASPTYVIDIAISVFSTMFILWLINRFWLTEPKILLALFWMMGVMVFIALVGVRFKDRLITGLANRWILMRGSKASFGERILVIGAGELGELALWMVNRSSFPDLFTVIGMVDDDPRKQNLQIMGYKVLGSTHEITELVKRYDIGLILFAISNCTKSTQKRVLSICQSTQAQTIIIPDFIKVLRHSIVKAEETTIT